MGNSILPNFTLNTKLCAVTDCGRKAITKGFCDKHYRRYRRSGDPLFVNKTRKRRDPPSFASRFWDRVDKTSNANGCWEWTGFTNLGGYGRLRWGAKKVLAHRAAWKLEHGKDASSMLLHSCDNPKCVNTDHLREGTHKDNANDKCRRNRQAKGSATGRAKLHETDVQQIKEMIALKTMKQTEIARMFGVGRSAIVRIKSGLTWAHV